jgi:hypothetical protein
MRRCTLCLLILLVTGAVCTPLTIPYVLKAFGHPEEVVIQREEYDLLFVIVPKPTRPPLVLVLRFSDG